MNDSTVKSLAITEKKVQKPGGCVGIFFQLIDWKRKLSKKKLFSKKLLPPARAKKFRGDEKMPNSKLHLIANENSGGFPSAKKGGNHGVDVEQKSEMRVPSLVARLMGLESIPPAQRDRSKKASNADSCGDVKEESLGNHCELDRQGVDLEIGIVKHDARPQKLQKTGVCERRAVTKFGADPLQIKSVLSRARKFNNHHHHPKLASPLKGPKVTSGKSASRSSRLIGAATKILEPGLQARSKSKGSLTYPASMYPPKTTGIVTNGAENRSLDMQNQSCYDAGTSKSLMGQTSCKNCGNLLDVVDCKLEVGGQPSFAPPVVSDVIVATSMVSSQKKGKSFASCNEQERDVVLLKSQPKLKSLVADEEGKNNEQQLWTEPMTRRMPEPHEGPAKWNSSCQPLRTLEDDSSFFASEHKTQTHEQMLSSERCISGSATSNVQVKRVSSSEGSMNGAKDFVALNRSLSGRTRTRSPTKVDSSKFDLEKKPYNRQQSSLSHVRTLERKRRTPNVSQLEDTTSVNSVSVKQRNLRSDVLRGERSDFNVSSLNSSIGRNKRDSRGEAVKVNNNDVVSFKFNSPVKQKMGIPTEKEESSSENERKTYFQRPSPLRVDPLGAFLELKLKELTSQRGEELAAGTPPKKSSAMILQELISALSSEHLMCHDDGHTFNENLYYHYGAKQKRTLGTCCNGNHLSPGSVLEASFSSSSLDESSGHGFHPDSTNYSYSQLEHDTELLDSATSFNKGRLGEILTDLGNQIPKVLQCLYSFGTKLTTSELNHIKDVLLNAELVLGIAINSSKDEAPELLIYRFLLDELDRMASDAMWTDFKGFVGCEDSRQRKELKGFIFDCVIEYLESHCCQYFNSGFNEWTKLPLCMKAEMLAEEVKKEIKKWACMVGMAADEIIEWEMSHSLGKWTDFDVEAFEAGADIDGDILQILVDEIVEELVACKQSSISF